MKSLLITAFFTCSVLTCSFAQQKEQLNSKEPKVSISKKKSESSSFSTEKQKVSQKPTSSKLGEGKSEKSRLPVNSRRINDPKLIKEREKAIQEKAKSGKKPNTKKPIEKPKNEDS